MKNKLTEVEQSVADAFVMCPHCQSNLCYHQDMGNGVEAMTCLSCGFTTTNQMLEGSETEKAVSANYPRLYKDLRYVDVHGFVWYPGVITVPDAGMIYIDGTSAEDWEWVATPVRKLTRKERRSGAYGNQEFIAIPSQTKRFGKDGYVQALAFLGLIGDEN